MRPTGEQGRDWLALVIVTVDDWRCLHFEKAKTTSCDGDFEAGRFRRLEYQGANPFIVRLFRRPPLAKNLALL